ncbi:MAG: GNAT family N-acetyltransferase [Clostridium sp.]|nr:GNAT family N-acetyltransferase [Clostridium sp.]MCM1398826.1 GNAT family N-acetyltransferase [Clostridium sp.]MCM1458542.1 GNAT family N-acetyltransferase [Bacteroides sp.]
MELNGDKICLISICEDDTKDIVKWRNSVRDKFIDRNLFTEESHTSWLNNVVRAGKAVQFVIKVKQDNKKIGSVFLKDIDKTHKKAEYGIFIGDSESQGKGYGTEAAKLITDYGFSVLGLHKIMLRVFAFNLGAVKSYEKAGFCREGYLKDEVCIDGRFYDMILMGMIKEEHNG